MGLCRKLTTVTATAVFLGGIFLGICAGVGRNQAEPVPVLPDVKKTASEADRDDGGAKPPFFEFPVEEAHSVGRVPRLAADDTQSDADPNPAGPPSP